MQKPSSHHLSTPSFLWFNNVVLSMANFVADDEAAAVSLRAARSETNHRNNSTRRATRPPDPPDPPRWPVSGDVTMSHILTLSSSMERLLLPFYSYMEVSLQQVSPSVDFCCSYSFLMMTSSNIHLLRVGVKGTIQVLGKLDNWIGKSLPQFPHVDYLSLIVGINLPLPWSVMSTIQPRFSTNRILLVRFSHVLVGNAPMLVLWIVDFTYHFRCVSILPRIEDFTNVLLVSMFETSLAIERTFTTVCRLCPFALGVIQFFSLSLWQVKRNEIVNAMFLINLNCLGTYFSGMEYVYFPMFPFLLSGFIAGRYEAMIANASVLILFESSVNQCISALVVQIMIDYSTIAAVSISDIGSPCVFFVSGIISPLSHIDVDLLHGFVGLSA